MKTTIRIGHLCDGSNLLDESWVDPKTGIRMLLRRRTETKFGRPWYCGYACIRGTSLTIEDIEEAQDTNEEPSLGECVDINFSGLVPGYESEGSKVGFDTCSIDLDESCDPWEKWEVLDSMEWLARQVKLAQFNSPNYEIAYRARIQPKGQRK